MAKLSTLSWSGHLQRMGNELAKRIYKNGVKAVGVRGQFLIKCEDTLVVFEGEKE